MDLRDAIQRIALEWPKWGTSSNQLRYFAAIPRAQAALRIAGQSGVRRFEAV